MHDDQGSGLPHCHSMQAAIDLGAWVALSVKDMCRRCLKRSEGDSFCFISAGGMSAGRGGRPTRSGAETSLVAESGAAQIC